MSTRAKRVLYPTVFLASVNFLSFFVLGLYFGGDALSGHVREGHYFLCMHGNCREVSASIWNYSYWHATTALGGIILVFVEAAILVTTGDVVFDFEKRA